MPTATDSAVANAAGVAAAASADIGLQLDTGAFLSGFWGALTGDAKTKTTLTLIVAGVGLWVILKKVA